MNKIIPLLFLVLTMLLWAANFHVVKIALDYYSPMGVAAWRFFFGALTLLTILYYRFGKSLFKINLSLKDWWFVFLTSFFGIFLTIYFFNAGLKTANAINGSLIIATSPAITAVYTYLFQQKKLKTVQWLAIGLSFFGVALILVKGDLNLLVQLKFEVGDMYILLMALVFSLSQVIVSKYLGHVDAILMTTISSLMALLLFFAFSFNEMISTALPESLPFWGSIIFMGVLATGIAYSAFYYCIIKLGPTTSSLYMNLIPLFTVLLAFPFGEKLYWIQLVGGIIIISGLLLFGVSKKQRRIPNKNPHMD